MCKFILSGCAEGGRKEAIGLKGEAKSGGKRVVGKAEQERLQGGKAAITKECEQQKCRCGSHIG